MKKYLSKISNGIILIILSLLHNQLAFSSDGFGKQFSEFGNSGFFKISGGMDELPALAGKTNFEAFAAFWFFYFGLLLIPIGLLVHSVEKEKKYLPASFNISYLLAILIGCYMIPNSGMTFIMLPHAIYMIVTSYIKKRTIENNMKAIRG